MMENVLLASALRLVAQMSIPILVAVLTGAVIAGVLRVATQIDDASIGFAGRFGAVVALLYFGSMSISKPVFDFALRLWGGTDFYH